MRFFFEVCSNFNAQTVAILLWSLVVDPDLLLLISRGWRARRTPQNTDFLSAELPKSLAKGGEQSKTRQTLTRKNVRNPNKQGRLRFPNRNSELQAAISNCRAPAKSQPKPLLNSVEKKVEIATEIAVIRVAAISNLKGSYMGVDAKWGRFPICPEMSRFVPVCPVLSSLGPRTGNKRGQKGTKQDISEQIGKRPNLASTPIDDRQITHLICPCQRHLLYDSFRGSFGPKKSYSNVLGGHRLDEQSGGRLPHFCEVHAPLEGPKTQNN